MLAHISGSPRKAGILVLFLALGGVACGPKTQPVAEEVELLPAGGATAAVTSSYQNTNPYTDNFGPSNTSTNAQFGDLSGGG